MSKLKVAYLGGRILGLQGLKILSAYKNKVDVCFVIANKEDGVKGSDWDPPILPYAKSLGFKTAKLKSLNSKAAVKLFKSNAVDVIFNLFCNRLIPQEILDIPKLGAINFHYGKLPQYRGRFIVSHIVLNNEKKSFATAHYMSAKVDTGDIIYERSVPVLEDDSAKTLYFRFTNATLELFKKILNDLIDGKVLPRRKQKGSGHYYPFKEINGCEINLNWKKDKVERFIRAVTFEPISRPWIRIGNLKFDIIAQV
ncbi:hypothetical protein HYS91_02965 [Candidatus Daviesbacteria bacterium]|nr:hypothetical protein [Candidatus Daviesbacteria bacterium]